MDVHLVAIKVSIVCAAVGIVHPNCLLFWQNLCQVSHHTRLVQGWLSVDQEDVAIGEVPVDNFLPDLELLCEAIPVFLRHLLQQYLATSLLVFDHVGAGMDVGTVAHELS